MLVDTLEQKGYTIANLENRERVDHAILYLPGLDSLVLSALDNPSFPVDGGWLRSACVYLWDRAELKIDRRTQTLSYAWNYWSPITLFFHATICGLFFFKAMTEGHLTLAELAVLLVGCGILNGFAALPSLLEQSRLNSLFRHCGFTSDSFGD